MKTPLTITTKEWQEIMTLPRVIETFELEENDTVETFSENIFGAKFNYTDKSADELSDLYILISGNIDEQNMMIKRMDGGLFVAE